MNYLAHLYLSGEFDEGMVGNLMADFAPGRVSPRLPAGIRQGIVLHRHIDAYTDAHPVVRVGKRRLHPGYHHYAAVVLDVFYDHFLALHWHRYHVLPLPVFAEQVYALLSRHQHVLPAAMQPVVQAMARQNWLVEYGTLDGIGKALGGLARRARFASGMERATDDLQREFAFYEDNFLRFFPDLKSFSDRWRQAEGAAG